MSLSHTPLGITPARNIKYLSASVTLFHIMLERREFTRLGGIVRGKLDRNAITRAIDTLTAGFVPLPVGLLTVLIAVRGEFATAAELEVWGSVIAVSAGGWCHGGGCYVVLSGGVWKSEEGTPESCIYVSFVTTFFCRGLCSSTLGH
jgi:hypothetical protein